MVHLCSILKSTQSIVFVFIYVDDIIVTVVFILVQDLIQKLDVEFALMLLGPLECGLFFGHSGQAFSQ